MESLSNVSKGNSPIKAELPHKVVGLATVTTMHTIDKEANPRLLKAVDQGETVTVLKTLHHTKW